MKKAQKEIIGWIVYIVILAGMVYGIPKALAYALKTPYPMAAITSGSMWPVLKRGDMVFIKGVNGKGEVKIDDIIVYKNPKGFTIHRVVSVNTDTVITKGDANNVSDAPVRYEEIVGKTITFKGKVVKIPKLGLISMLINKERLQASF